MQSTVVGLLVILLVSVAKSDNHYKGKGTVMCESMMEVPHGHCDPSCQGDLFCAPTYDNQMFKFHADDGTNKMISTGKGHITCNGLVSFHLEDPTSTDKIYCQLPPNHPPGLFCGAANCTGTFEANWDD